MLKQLLQAILVVLPALALSTASVEGASGIEGTWTGRAYQNEGSSGYTVILTITPTMAESRYPELNCAGKLSRVGQTGGYVFFAETIIRDAPRARGTCIDGTITVAPAMDRLAWGWFGSLRTKLTWPGLC